VQVNLNDWLGHHPWAWWLALVVLLMGAEVVHRGRVALALALGSGAAAGVAWLVPTRGLAQALIAIGVALGSVLLLTRRAVHPDDLRRSGR
jgi:membrane protein implicated in regulation of membrane protease activity